jgi:hypothetical protein
MFSRFKTVFSKKEVKQEPVIIKQEVINNNNYTERKAVTLNNIENLELLHTAKKEGLLGVNLGNIYIYDSPIPYILEDEKKNISNNSIKNITSTNSGVNISLLEFYTLNNFLYSKKLYEENTNNENFGRGTISSYNEHHEKYALKLFPFEESLQTLEKMKTESNIEQLKTSRLKIKRDQNKLITLKESKKELEGKIRNISTEIDDISRYVIILKEDYSKKIVLKRIDNIEKEIKNRSNNKVSGEIIESNNVLSTRLKELNDIILYFDKKRFYKDKIDKLINIRDSLSNNTNEDIIKNLIMSSNTINYFLEENNEEYNIFIFFNMIILSFKLLKLIYKKEDYEIILDELKEYYNTYKDTIKNNNDRDVISYIDSIIKINFNEKSKEMNTIIENNYKSAVKIIKKYIPRLDRDINSIQKKIEDLDNIYEPKINNIINKQNGGFVDPVSASLLLFISFITVAYMHFSIVIKLFITFILLKCSKKMEGKSRKEFIREFMLLHFQELFISYILIILSCFLGPFVLILDNCITEYLIVFLIGEGVERIRDVVSSIKLKKVFEYLSFKGTKVSVESTLISISSIPKKIYKIVADEAQHHIHNKSHKLSCIYKISGLKSIAKVTSTSLLKNGNTKISTSNNSRNNINNIFAIKYVKIVNNYYIFNIIDLKNNTIYGYIEFSKENADKLYFSKKLIQKEADISIEKKNTIMNILFKKNKKINPYFDDFWYFSTNFYKN